MVPVVAEVLGGNADPRARALEVVGATAAIAFIVTFVTLFDAITHLCQIDALFVGTLEFSRTTLAAFFV